MGMAFAKKPPGRSLFLSRSSRNSFGAANKKGDETQEGAASFSSRKESRK
jgi:hypothetical protein